MELSANVSPLKDITSTKNQQPIIALDFEAFCYIDQSPHPTKFKEILALLYDVQQYGVKIVLFVENIEKAKKFMLDAYGEYAKRRFFRNLVDTQLNKKRTMLQYLSPYRSSQLATARAIPSSDEQHLEYVLFYSPLDSEISKFKVKANCQLIKIEQTGDDTHIEALKEVVANFKEIKDVKERIKEQLLIKEKNELLNSQSYAEATHKYYYTKAEAQVIGDITEFLKDIRVNLLVEKKINQAITTFDKSNSFVIGNLFNTWNIYDCLIQALSSIRPKIQYDITYIKSEILGYILNLQQNQNNWLIKNFSKEIYETFKSFLNLSAKDIEYHISEMGAEGPDKWITWDQINIDAVCLCAVFKIKLHIIYYSYTTHNKIIFSDVRDDDHYIENVEEDITHLLVDEHGTIPVDPEDKRLQDSSIIRLGVYDKTSLNRYFKEGEKTPNRTSIKSIKNYTCILQKSLVKPEMIYSGYPSDYTSCIDKILNQLQLLTLKQINNRVIGHHNDLIKNERFARETTDGYEWFFYATGNNGSEELSHFKDYLTKSANDCIKEYIVIKVKLYHDPIEFLEVCNFTILPIASELENSWKSYTDELETTSLRVTAISKQIDKCKFRHNFSMTASLSNFNIASPVDITIPGVHGACMGSLKNFIVELEKEKKRLSTFDINRYTQQFININQSRQSKQEQLAQEIPSCRGEGRNLLQNSVYHGNYEVTQHILLVEKAKINFKRNDNDLPILFYWVRALNRDSENTNAQLLFQLLIENGAKLNETSTNSLAAPGGTFIHFAAILGNYLTINFILSYLIQSKMGDANNFQLSFESSQTALYSVATHDDFNIINDEPSDHYLVAEQFFLYGIIFDSNEIESLVKYYQEKNQSHKLEILQKLFNMLIDKYKNDSEDSFNVISPRHKLRLFSNGNIHEVEPKEFVDFELARNFVYSWLEQLKLQNSSPSSQRKNSASFLDRVASSLKKPFSKPHLTETRPKSGSFSAESFIKTSSLTRLNQTVENKLPRPSSVELLPDSNNFLRHRSATQRDMSNPLPPILGSSGMERVITVELLTSLDENGFAAIHYAAMTGSLPLFNYLMEHSKDIAERKKFLSICCHADLTGQNKLKQNYTPIYFAVMFRQVEFVKELINQLARLMPEKINDCSRTPLHAAIEDSEIPIKESERIELVKILLDYALKFNFNSCIYSKDFAGHTPCMKALLSGNKAVLKLFLERKIWIPASDIIGALTKIKDAHHRNKIINLIKEVLMEHSAKLKISNNFSPRKA